MICLEDPKFEIIAISKSEKTASKITFDLYNKKSAYDSCNYTYSQIAISYDVVKALANLIKEEIKKD